MATVENTVVRFSPGLNVMTGETGAGKSVLAHAVALAAGAKASAEIVREGESEARIEAEFKECPASTALALEEAGLPASDEPGMLTIRRTIKSAGGGRVWINDAPATLATLRKVCGNLVSCHGTGEGAMLADEDFLLGVLDGGGRGAYDEAWKAYAACKAALEELEGAGAGEDEMDMLRYQVGELEEVSPSPDDDDIRRRHMAAARAGETLERGEAATEVLSGDDGAAALLARLGLEFARMAKALPEAAEWAEEAERIATQINELSRTVADAMAHVEADEGEFEALDARLAQIDKLKRKYMRGGDAGEGDGTRLAAMLEAKRERLAALEGREENLAKLRKEVEAAFAVVKREGAALSRRRTAAAKAFSGAVTAELRDLGFLQAMFRVELARCECTATGCDAARCIFAPNPGEGERDLAQTASSGETARVMLAVQRILASREGAGTVLFDEIDSNVGGETARVVGRKLLEVAKDRQVIAITHMPQSAAGAQTHIVVEKKTQGERTRSTASTVEGRDRVRELARMLGGATDGDAAWRHAEELAAI